MLTVIYTSCLHFSGTYLRCAKLLDLVNHMQRSLQLRHTDLLFKLLLHLVEGPDGLHRAPSPLWFQDKLNAASVLRIDAAFQQTARFQRREAIADVASPCRKCFCQMGRFRRPRLLKQNCYQYQRFKKGSPARAQDSEQFGIE